MGRHQEKWGNCNQCQMEKYAYVGSRHIKLLYGEAKAQHHHVSSFSLADVQVDPKGSKDLDAIHRDLWRVQNLANERKRTRDM